MKWLFPRKNYWNRNHTFFFFLQLNINILFVSNVTKEIKFSISKNAENCVENLHESCSIFFAFTVNNLSFIKNNSLKNFVKPRPIERRTDIDMIYFWNLRGVCVEGGANKTFGRK